MKWVALLLVAVALIALHLHVAVDTSNVLTYNADIYLKKLLGLEITSASLKIGHVEVSLVAPGGYVYATTTIWYPIVSFCVSNNGSYSAVIKVTRVHLYKGEALIAYNEVQRRPSVEWVVPVVSVELPVLTVDRGRSKCAEVVVDSEYISNLEPIVFEPGDYTLVVEGKLKLLGEGIIPQVGSIRLSTTFKYPS
ncbi:MAG: hypothetical protein RRE21_01550 [Desulfurococcales archaeon]|nr:hypothetical protein [Desulfurococcales archaeon]